MKLVIKFSWIDIVSFIIFVRVIYIAAGRGLLNESIKLLGMFSGVFFALQYYPVFLKRLNQPPFSIHQTYLNIISFVIIFSFVGVLFFALRKGATLFIPHMHFSLWEKISSLLLGIIRASLLISVFLFIVYLFKGNVYHSITFPIFKNVAPAVYLKTHIIYRRINSAAALNKEVSYYYEAKGSLPGYNRKGY